MTREEAINILKQYREKPTLINEIETVEEAVWLDEALDMAIKALEQEPKWIPVSERLPKDDVKVLITTDEGETETAHRSTQAWTDDEYEWVIYDTFGYEDSLLDDEVIAWMPLPEPYKAESEERNEI